MSYGNLGQKKSGFPRIGGRKAKSPGGGGPTIDSGQKGSGVPKLGVRKSGTESGSGGDFPRLASEVRGYKKFRGGSGSLRSTSASKVKKGSLGG